MLLLVSRVERQETVVVDNYRITHQLYHHDTLKKRDISRCFVACCSELSIVGGFRVVWNSSDVMHCIFVQPFVVAMVDGGWWMVDVGCCFGRLRAKK